jgi:hypothetical protein
MHALRALLKLFSHVKSKTLSAYHVANLSSAICTLIVYSDYDFVGDAPKTLEDRSMSASSFLTGIVKERKNFCCASDTQPRQEGIDRYTQHANQDENFQDIQVLFGRELSKVLRFFVGAQTVIGGANEAHLKPLASLAY